MNSYKLYSCVLLLLQLTACDCKFSPHKAFCAGDVPVRDGTGYDRLEEYALFQDQLLYEGGYIAAPGDFWKVLSYSPTFVRYERGPFQCGGKYSVGCTVRGVVQLWATKCIGLTAFGHELVHVYLSRSGVADGDPAHRTAIWHAESQWLGEGIRKFCPAESGAQRE